MKEKILEWFVNGEVGESSKAMAACIAGIDGGGSSHPRDPADFNRCLMFLEAVPEARLHMDKLRRLSLTWDRLVERWDEVESVFLREVGLDWKLSRRAIKTYKLMEEIYEG